MSLIIFKKARPSVRFSTFFIGASISPVNEYAISLAVEIAIPEKRDVINLSILVSGVALS